jgi:16S rRNA (adenine1518-N6/adenine1519-N6)-dimethyltransferase
LCGSIAPLILFLRDLSDIVELKAVLSKFGGSASKKFGQNFLIDSAVLDSLVDASELSVSDVIVEVGAGPGVLTQRLAKSGAVVKALEIDGKLIPLLKSTVSECKNVEVIHTDVLHWKPIFWTSPSFPREGLSYKVIANIPYYITSPILKHFLRRSTHRPSKIVLMIQREVAERICSETKPTLLSWEVRLFGVPRIVCTVPPSSFYPSPKVDSAVICIDIFDEPLVAPQLIDTFFGLLEKAYKQPRKTLGNNLKGTDVIVPEKMSGLRAHQLGIDDWNNLCVFS